MSKKPTKRQLDSLLAAYEARKSQFELFRMQVEGFFLKSPQFQGSPLPLVHSVKSRLKDPDHLRDKIIRKFVDEPITEKTLFSRITDFAGVRVLHLHSLQFAEIHKEIRKSIDDGFWSLMESPVAYSWDPEATAALTALGIDAKTRESYYTSIHYVVKPRPESDLSCEIQVRTLFEEAWGEIDHALNYPHPTDNIACREQLRVMAKFASTGTRLADSIFKSINN
ncbi:RelA/SpoT domain-containing protein [Delftia acidovorans]|uniref:RelA/SpoT domain-containing protein n=1 Tax=Delftia acidovorans TaxID=80866 RepID=UPI00241E52A3|nr:RelA/SpoT domain-containing protein [Delftia acidovorans]